MTKDKVLIMMLIVCLISIAQKLISAIAHSPECGDSNLEPRKIHSHRTVLFKNSLSLNISSSSPSNKCLSLFIARETEAGSH